MARSEAFITAKAEVLLQLTNRNIQLDDPALDSRFRGNDGNTP